MRTDEPTGKDYRPFESKDQRIRKVKLQTATDNFTEETLVYYKDGILNYIIILSKTEQFKSPSRN